MTPDLLMLVYAVILAIVQIVVTAAGGTGQLGLVTLAGNRDSLPDLTGWAGRASRAHRNLMESLPLFAALVLVAHIAGVANETTALGAQIFLYARIVYAIVYIIGVPWLRTVIWFISVVGMLMILYVLLTGGAPAA